MTGDEAVSYARGYGDASEDYAARAAEREVSAYAQGLADAAEQFRTRYWTGYAEALEDLGRPLSACGAPQRRRPLHGRRPPGRAR